MDYSIGVAIGAGAVATLVMTAIMYMGRAMMPQQMPMNILYMLGSMMTSNKMPAYVMGAMMHAVNGIVFAIVHTALYQAFGLESGLLGWGILFGFIHWIIVGMGLGMMGMMHPMMRRGDMDAPGAFAMRLPMMNVMGFLMLHLVYGLVLGALYEAWA